MVGLAGIVVLGGLGWVHLGGQVGLGCVGLASDGWVGLGWVVLVEWVEWWEKLCGWYRGRLGWDCVGVCWLGLVELELVKLNWVVLGKIGCVGLGWTKLCWVGGWCWLGVQLGEVVCGRDGLSWMKLGRIGLIGCVGLVGFVGSGRNWSG